MSVFTLATFEQAISRYFEPIAHEHGWRVTRQSDDAFEIRSPYCAMTVSFHDGAHTRSVNAILAPVSAGSDESKRQQRTIGIWPIAGYNGVDIKKYVPREKTAEGFFAEAEYVSKMVKAFCLPYLLGQKSDWDQVSDYWKKVSEGELEKIKSCKFPPNVQKRWHLPPPSEESKQ